MTMGSAALEVSKSEDLHQARTVGRDLARAWGFTPVDQTRVGRAATALAAAAVKLWGPCKITFRVVPGTHLEMEYEVFATGPVVHQLAEAPADFKTFLDDVRVKSLRNRQAVIIGRTRTGK